MSVHSCEYDKKWPTISLLMHSYVNRLSENVIHVYVRGCTKLLEICLKFWQHIWNLLLLSLLQMASEKKMKM